MRNAYARMAATIVGAAFLLSGCGGGGGGGGGDATAPPPPPPTVNVGASLTSAAAVAANDTATNSTASFSVLQSAGVPAVTVNSAPKVNFAVFSGGQLKTGITTADVSVVIAKLVPGTNGNPDEWVSYTYRTETATAGVGPNSVPAMATATQATSDTKMTAAELTAAGLTSQLVYNTDGYYTYQFKTDITKPDQTRGVTFEPNRTHRVAIQLRYTDAAGNLVRVNPYFDFTIDSSGKSVPADASASRKMVDVATCNNCHDRLALHGGGRVDTQYCVLCHNPSTRDANSGNVLTMSTMVHKIHSGKELHAKGENYVIWGNSNSKHDYTEVGFPQPTRNCSVCHTGTNPATPQGDNWKSKPSKEACLTCHQTGSTTSFYATHVTTLKLGANADAIANSTCVNCHSASSPLSAEKAHWVQEMANAKLYDVKIESVTLTKAPVGTATGTISVKYAIVNPATGAAYDLREGCAEANTTDSAGTAIVGCNANYRWDAVLPPALPGKPPNKFGTFSLYVGANTQPQNVDDVTATASYAAYRGVVDANKRYTANLTVPAGARGNLRIMMTGAVAERRVDPITGNATGANPPVRNSDIAYVPVKNVIYEFDLSTKAKSTTTARRQLVSNDNCNTCHGILGLPTSADPDKPGFHKGVRNNADGCHICHNANQAGSYTLMADGSTGPVAGDSQLAAGNTSNFLHESYQAKRFVHGIHYGAKRNYPFTHCMKVGGEYNKDGTSKTVAGLVMGNATCSDQYPGETTNFTSHVAYPGQLRDCANCHVNDSWKQDRSVLGSVVFKPTGVTNMLDWYVISPKAATCTSCHDSKATQTHIKTVGATFGALTQNDLLNRGLVFESCEGCHIPGGALGVDVVHKRQ